MRSQARLGEDRRSVGLRLFGSVAGKRRPTRLASEARWRAGVRLPPGRPKPSVNPAPRPPFHRIRTVAADQCCAARHRRVVHGSVSQVGRPSTWRSEAS